MVTQGLHHDVFLVLFKTVTFYNAVCIRDDGQTGAASSHTRTLQCASALQSLFRYSSQQKRLFKEYKHHFQKVDKENLFKNIPHSKKDLLGNQKTLILKSRKLVLFQRG